MHGHIARGAAEAWKDADPRRQSDDRKCAHREEEGQAPLRARRLAITIIDAQRAGGLGHGSKCLFKTGA